MDRTEEEVTCRIQNRLLVVTTVLCGLIFFPCLSMGQTYGIKDPSGNFQPKVIVNLGNNEIIIKKTNPQDKFRSISLTLNPKNSALIRNVGMLNVEWVNVNGKPGKVMPFSGPRYDAGTRKFEDSMGKSVEFRLLDNSNRNIFAGKTISDLFEIRIDDQPVLSSESVLDRDRTVQMGTGRDVSINVDKTSVVFNENNLKKGEILNVDNRSGLNQVLGIEFPERGLLYHQIIRKPEQTKIPRDSWKRFTVGADSGIFIVMIPEPDQAQLVQLNGKEILIKIFQGNNVRETFRVPIKTASDLRLGSGDVPARSEIPASQPVQRTTSIAEPQVTGAGEGREVASNLGRQAASASPATTQKVGSWSDIKIWVLQIVNLVLLAGLAIYGIFFMLPKIQVLQDRLAKNEMFIHPSREAIREEIELIKEEIQAQNVSHKNSE